MSTENRHTRKTKEANILKCFPIPLPQRWNDSQRQFGHEDVSAGIVLYTNEIQLCKPGLENAPAWKVEKIIWGQIHYSDLNIFLPFQDSFWSVVLRASALRISFPKHVVLLPALEGLEAQLIPVLCLNSPLVTALRCLDR